MSKQKASAENLEEVSPEPGLKSCFIITPIGSVGSDIYIKTEGLVNAVISPVLKEFGFEAMPAHRMDSSGSITKQIIRRIIEDDIVIANLTGNNPNVMYELAIRHSFGKKVITMAEHGTTLPFDIHDQRAIFYHDTLLGAELAKVDLRQKLSFALQETEDISNPIYDSVKEFAFIKSATKGAESESMFEYMIERFDRLERNVRNSISKTETSGRMTLFGGEEQRKASPTNLVTVILKIANESDKMIAHIRNVADNLSQTGLVTVVRLNNGDVKVTLPTALDPKIVRSEFQALSESIKVVRMESIESTLIG